MFADGDLDQLSEEDEADLDPDDIMLYQYAQVCRVFPGYTLETLQQAPAADLLRAIRLMDIAAKMKAVDS